MSFASDVERFVRKAKEALDKTMQDVVEKSYSEIVMRTPIDEGDLIKSWEVSNTNPKWGDVVSISTDLVYAPVIEYGLYPGVGPKTVKRGNGIYSTQAPQGMVRITAKEMKDWAEVRWSQHAP